ncbi:flagellar hook-basal body complex protein FliE [Arthrobacter sp. GAS37]|uniref:alpha/beta hydrolase n=1 Tax=Arthrobacter sp. GAS37 TaxID=3156261 RepID=UPI00383240A5
MQWTEQEPDAADLVSGSLHRDRASEHMAQADLVRRSLQDLINSVGAQWQGEAANAWTTGVTSVVEILSRLHNTHSGMHAVFTHLYDGLHALRESMDGVRQRETVWQWELDQSRAHTIEHAQWLSLFDPASLACPLDDVPDHGSFPSDTPEIKGRRINLAGARDMVLTAEKNLAQAQAEREECVRRRRDLNSNAAHDLAALTAGLPRDLPVARGGGASAVPATLGLSLIRASLAGMSNKELAELAVKHPDLAQLLAGTLPAAGAAVPGVDPATMTALAGLVGSPVTVERGRAITALFATLTPDLAERLALLYPGLGNIDGVPFENRYAANRINVAAALKTRQDNQPSLDQTLKSAQDKVNDLQKRSNDYTLNGEPRTGGDTQGINPLQQDLDKALQDLSTAEQAAKTNPNLITNYDKYLNQATPSYEVGPDGKTVPDRTGHQILVFSDNGPGAIAEVWGNVATSKQIGVAVPGTTENMTNFPDNSHSMAENAIISARGQGALGTGMAMIAWAGGEFPQNVPIFSGEGLLPPQGAQDPSYANELGARLYRFSEALNAEAVTPGAVIDSGAHSYGGAALGVALHLGMKVHGALFIEAAGLGPGITSTSDYPHEATTRFYQTTAPGDPIGISRDFPVLGADPSRVPGIASLETGFKDDNARPGGELLSGEPAHNGVFNLHSTAQQNIAHFYSGQPMEARAPEGHLMDPGYKPLMVDPNGTPWEKIGDFRSYVNSKATPVP